MSERPTPKEFLKLPKAQRNSILQEQAQALEEHYAAPSDWDGVGTEEDVIKILKERDEAREELREWQTLRLWGAEPQHIHDFIKGQQARIHESQDIEKTCEQLERERDEALTELEMWRDGNILHEIHRDELEKAERERDEAIADRDIARIAAMESDKAHDRMVWELEKVYKERDEAWACCDELVVDSSAISLANTVMRLERERDEARADRDIARLAAMDSDKAHDRMVGELEKAYKERDEAREALAGWLGTPVTINGAELNTSADHAIVMAIASYRYADAMLAERNRKEEA
jgi:hypothetical protein